MDHLSGWVSYVRTRLCRHIAISGLLLAALIATQLPLLAQFASGSISSTVTDSTGAVIPKATVTLTNEQSLTNRETVTQFEWRV